MKNRELRAVGSSGLVWPPNCERRSRDVTVLDQRSVNCPEDACVSQQGEGSHEML